MIINAAAIIIGYLLGSIPSAYIITRLLAGKDIRQLGSGNIGALNVSRVVGRKAGIAVFLADAGKGVAVVAIATWVLGVPGELFTLLAALAAAVGHMWSAFLRFSGGRGMATVFGILIIFMPLYGYQLEFWILLGVLFVSLMVTHRNFALSMIAGLISLPISTWFVDKSWPFIAVSVALLVLVVLKTLPIARAAWARSRSVKDFIRGQ